MCKSNIVAFLGLGHYISPRLTINSGNAKMSANQTYIIHNKAKLTSIQPIL